jgi:hypothetical protein
MPCPYTIPPSLFWDTASTIFRTKPKILMPCPYTIPPSLFWDTASTIFRTKPKIDRAFSLPRPSLIAPPSICRDTASTIFRTKPKIHHAVSLHHTPIALLGHGIRHLSDKTKKFSCRVPTPYPRRYVGTRHPPSFGQNQKFIMPCPYRDNLELKI